MYNPQRELLTASLNALNEQVDEIFLGDNSVNMPDFITTLLNLYPNTYYHSFNKNLGIAEAQNRGIIYFQKKGFDFVLFMDQDSLAPNNLVSSLLADYNRLKEIGIPIGGIGPRPFNRGEGKPYIGAVKKRKINPTQNYGSWGNYQFCIIDSNTAFQTSWRDGIKFIY